MRKMVVTGASGFIGSYFIQHYCKTYDILSFSFSLESFDSLVCEGVDTVLHLSALVHQMDGGSNEEYQQVNVGQTLRLAKKAKKSGVKHFVFMSTVKVYGEESDTPYTEDSPCIPMDGYGKSKLQAERELQALEDESFKVAIVRTPIVYGKGVKANMKSLISLVTYVPLLPLGSIENRRSVVYVGNLCHVIHHIIQLQASGIFLANDDKSLSTTELIRFIAQTMEKKVYLFEMPLFASLLKLFSPTLYQRLYASLEVDNHITKERLKLTNPYSTLEGFKNMVSV